MSDGGFCDELPDDVMTQHESTARNLANLWSDGGAGARQAIFAALCRETLRMARGAPVSARIPYRCHFCGSSYSERQGEDLIPERYCEICDADPGLDEQRSAQDESKASTALPASQAPAASAGGEETSSKKAQRAVDAATASCEADGHKCSCRQFGWQFSADNPAMCNARLSAVYAALANRPTSQVPAASAGQNVSEFQQRYAERLHHRATNSGWTALMPGGDTHSPGTQFYWLNLAGIASQEFKALTATAQAQPAGREEIKDAIRPILYRLHGGGEAVIEEVADAILAARPGAEGDAEAMREACAAHLERVADLTEANSRGDLGSMFASQSASDLRREATRIRALPVPPAARPAPSPAKGGMVDVQR